MSYTLFKFLALSFFDKHIKNKKILKMVDSVNKISFSNLVVLVALPFTPAFMINIACGLAKIGKKKFIAAILIGKMSITVFWGCIGKSLLESITDIKTIMIVSIFILVAYIASRIVSKKLEIE